MCLKRLNYDRKELERRREETQHEIKGQQLLHSPALPKEMRNQPPKGCPATASLLSPSV